MPARKKAQKRRLDEEANTSDLTKKARVVPRTLNPLEHYLLTYPNRQHRMAFARLTTVWTPIFILTAEGCNVIQCTEKDTAVIPEDMRAEVVRLTMMAPRNHVACFLDDKRFHNDLAFGFFEAKLKAIPVDILAECTQKKLDYIRAANRAVAASQTARTNVQWEMHVLQCIAFHYPTSPDGVMLEHIVQQLGPTPVIQAEEHEQIHQVVYAAERLRDSGKIVMVELQNRLALKLA
jgi:hypothetical protein